MPLRRVPDIKADDRHPRGKWDSPERRKERQKEYMKKHGEPGPRRKRLATTDKHKEVRKILKDPAGFKPLRASKQGGGRTNLLEELGRVEAEPSNRNRRAEISRVHGELNRGYAEGRRVGKKRKTDSKLYDRPKWGSKGPGRPKGLGPKGKLPKGYRRYLPVGAEGIFGLGVKGKPHSSPEGRKATSKLAIKRLMGRGKTPGDKLRDRLKDLDKGRLVPDPRHKPGPRKPIDPRSPYIKDRVMTPLRTKKGIGGAAVNIIKKIASKIKPKPKGSFKPKPVPKAVTDRPTGWSPKGSYTKADDKKINSMLKKLGDEIKAQPLPPKLKKTMKRLQKAYSPHKKAAGGRIKKGYGGSAAQQHYLKHGYGPTKTKLRSGKPKIAIKGW